MFHQDLPECSVGDKVRHVRDGIDKVRTLVNLKLDPSQSQLQFTIQCTGNETVQTTRDFFKLSSDE